MTFLHFKRNGYFTWEATRSNRSRTKGFKMRFWRDWVLRKKYADLFGASKIYQYRHPLSNSDNFLNKFRKIFDAQNKSAHFFRSTHSSVGGPASKLCRCKLKKTPCGPSCGHLWRAYYRLILLGHFLRLQKFWPSTSGR